MNIHIGGAAGGGGGGWNQCGASGGAGGRASGIWAVDANKTFRYYVGDGGVGG